MSEKKPTKTYRGVELDAELAALIRHMPAVDATREALQALQGVWDSLALLSELSGTGVEIAGIRAAFATLTSRLINEIGQQARHKAALAQLARAQVTVDILVRNLFERTADIGFLATDEDLRGFAVADADTRAQALPALRRRLQEYQRKYSVYDDIILLAPDGTVLARLDETVELPRTRDQALLDEALQTARPYVEVYRPFDLRPGSARSLVYASRVTDTSGQRPVGVLCLSFRFEDECRRIFRKFVGTNDWSVVALLDGDGGVLASSDPLQVPLSAQVAVPDDGQAHVLRFGGRHWLAVSCAAHPFQGYAGPGWRGHAMTPLEHAFAVEDDEAERLDADAAARLRGSRVLYPDSLRDIAAAAQRIESELARAVWNGNLALIADAQGGNAATANAGFSRSLLREIGRTGARTRDSFTLALDQVSGSVAAATLAGARSRAALAADIMDRSLYERANDCRWWALTTLFRQSLEAAGSPDAAALERVLRTIHGLYTVYASLVLYDREGRIVAASGGGDGLRAGQALEGDWVARSLALPDTQAYCVSAFEPSALYDGRPTYVYAAAVRGLAEPGRVVGGIAIVFDAEPQLRSMLQDTLPRDAAGRPLPGAFGAFVDGQGRVLACSHAEPAVGTLLDASGELRAAAASGSRAWRWQERWYIAGAARSSGYREFKGPHDPYREEVTALVFEAMTEAGAASEVPAEIPALPPAAAARGGGERVDLATLRIGDQWHALTGRDLIEAMPAERLLPLPGRAPHVRGSVMFRDAPIAVIEADRLLGQPGAAPARGRQIVVLQPPRAQGRPFGLLVDALGDNPEVHASQLVRLAEGRWQRGPGGAALIDTVVAPAPGHGGQGLLTLLSADALAGLVTA